MNGLPAIKWLDTVIEVQESPATRANGNPSHQPKPKTVKARQIMAATRQTSRFDAGPVAESFENFKRSRKQHLKRVQKAHRNLQCWSLRLARACMHQTAEVAQMISIMEHFWTDTLSVTNCSRQFHRT